MRQRVATAGNLTAQGAERKSSPIPTESYTPVIPPSPHVTRRCQFCKRPTEFDWSRTALMGRGIHERARPLCPSCWARRVERTRGSWTA